MSVQVNADPIKAAKRSAGKIRDTADRGVLRQKHNASSKLDPGSCLLSLFCPTEEMCGS